MSIALRTKYLSIKKEKLSETGKTVLKSMYDATDGFKDAKATRKIKPKFEAFYDKLKKSKPEAIKGATKPKETPTAKQFKEARERRKSQTGVPKKESDIKKDADRPAIDRKGKRVTDGTHYPYKKGNVYYEYRDNRYDKRPAKYPKLEDGGELGFDEDVRETKRLVTAFVKRYGHVFPMNEKIFIDNVKPREYLGHGAGSWNGYRVTSNIGDKIAVGETKPNIGFLSIESDINPNGISGKDDIGRTYVIHLEIKGRKRYSQRSYVDDGVYFKIYNYGRNIAEVLEKIEDKMSELSRKINKDDLRFFEIPNSMAKGGNVQGYDDREDERLSMEHGKMSMKDLHTTHARRDDARFEERGKMAKGGQINMNKHIWEGWTVGSFIEDLELPFRYHQKFKSRDEVKKWAMSEQPYYKKYIPEVVDYFWEKNDEKYADGGMMAKGGELKSHKVAMYKNDKGGVTYIPLEGKERMYNKAQVKQLIKDVYGKTIQGSVSFEDTKEWDDEMYKQVTGKKEHGGIMALGGMTPGRWYKDNQGNEFKYIGEDMSGRSLFNDGERTMHKTLDDFEPNVKETKMFGWFGDGGYMAKGGEVNKHTYMMLSRLQSDNEYFLGYGNRNPKQLWAGNVDDQIAEMKKLWNQLPEDGKPEWLSMEDIEEYEMKMKNNEMANGGEMLNGGEEHRSDGGDQLFADGGKVDNGNVEMVMSNTKAIEHHAQELKKLVDMNTPIEAWVVAKLERAETDLSDVTHYIDGLKSKFADGGELEGHEVEIFFNTKDKVADPYTVIVDGSVYSMSGTTGPYSVNLYVGEIDEFSPQAVKGWGKKINFVNAEPELISQIESRFEDEYAKGGKVKFYDIVDDLIDYDVQYDGDPTDLRLFSELRYSWGADNEKDYEKAQSEIDKIKYEGKGWEVYASYDTSSYNYWMKQQEEQNYINIAILFDEDTIDESEVKKLKEALSKAISKAEDISLKYDYDPQNNDDEYAKGGMMQHKGLSNIEKNLSNSSLKVLEKKFLSNEDKNYHSENVVLLAEYFGNEDDKLEANRILNLHKKEGNLSSENGKKRYELFEKLVRKWDETKEKVAKGERYAKGGELPFENSNLYLNGFGMDTNGNSVVKVSFPNQRAFSIQTNGVLKETNNLYTKNINDLSDAQKHTIEKEVVEYVKEFGSDEQKKRLKTYSGYMANGGYLAEKTSVEVGNEKISVIKRRKEKTGYPVYVNSQGYAPMTLDVYPTKELAIKKAKALANKEGYSFSNWEKVGEFKLEPYAKGGAIKGGKFKVGDKVMISEGYTKMFTGFDISQPAKIIKVDKSKFDGNVKYLYYVELADGQKPFNPALESRLTLVEDKMAKGGRLSRKQKQLDLNKNGKLDSQDFKMLRAKRKNARKK